MDGSNYISIALGVLLSTSEILPYIKNIKGNGIIDTIHRVIVYYLKYESDQELQEHQPLLSQEHQPDTLVPSNTIINIDTKPLIEQLQLLNKPIEFESLDKYEMIYIINYIKNHFDKKSLNIHSLSLENKKTLESLHYNIDFDSTMKMYNINW